MFKMKLIITSLIFSFGSVYCLAQNNNAKSIDVLKTETAAAIQSNYDSYKNIALSISIQFQRKVLYLIPVVSLFKIFIFAKL